jgi:hypothetical protein
MHQGQRRRQQEQVAVVQHRHGPEDVALVVDAGLEIGLLRLVLVRDHQQAGEDQGAGGQQ